MVEQHGDGCKIMKEALALHRRAVVSESTIGAFPELAILLHMVLAEVYSLLPITQRHSLCGGLEQACALHCHSRTMRNIRRSAGLCYWLSYKTRALLLSENYSSI